MDTQNVNVESVNNSNTNDTSKANEIDEPTQQTSQEEKVTHMRVKAIITAITRGNSDETSMSLFFRSQNAVFPKTDENGTHSMGFSFGKRIQCIEDLISLYPFRVKAKFSQIKDLDDRLEFANMLFQSMTSKTFIVTFDLIPANVAYRNAFSKPHDWWCATNISGPAIDLDRDEMTFILDEGQKYIDKEQKEMPEWTQVQ